MASDLDTVRVMRALFSDIPRAPQGLSHEDTMAWIQKSMQNWPGGDLAYTIEHVTRNSMLDIVLRLREDGHLKDDAQFESTLRQLSHEAGRKEFMDWCINAQKSVDATSRLLNRARPTWSEPTPLFSVAPEHVRRFVAGEPTGAGAMFAEFAARDDVKHLELFADGAPERLFEFDWGFVTEAPGMVWNVYVADVWRAGTVGCFDRFIGAWRLETAAAPGSQIRPPHVPAGLSLELGITAFASLSLLGGSGDPATAAERKWIGEVFLAHMLPAMCGRVLDPNYDFPSAW
ncbi:MAG: hypothetical protein WEK74_07470 [Hydrogenophaga sp.]